VQFPGSWIGSTDELVPFGLPVDSADPEPDHPDLASAQSFWSEDAASLHAPVQAAGSPPPYPSAEDRAAFRRPRLRTQLRRVGFAGLIALLGVAVIASLAAALGSGARRNKPIVVAGRVAPPTHVAASLRPRVAHGVVSQSGPRPRARPISPRRGEVRRHLHRGPSRHPRQTVIAARRHGHSTATASSAAVTTSPPATIHSSGAYETHSQSSSDTTLPTPASGTQPAFGANGTLGPGSSPNG
jgi:hypothetical protein